MQPTNRLAAIMADLEAEDVLTGREAGADLGDHEREEEGGVDRVEADHHLVTRHLGENRGGADTRPERIAVDDRLVAALERQASE